MDQQTREAWSKARNERKKAWAESISNKSAQKQPMPSINRKVWIGFAIVAVLFFILNAGLNYYDDSQPKNSTSDTVNFFEAYRQCVDMTKQRAKYPSSFDDGWPNQEFYKNSGSVRVDFAVKNAFGMKVEGYSYCPVRDGVVMAPTVHTEDENH